MSVVKGEVLRPVWARFRELEYGSYGRVVFRQQVLVRDDLHLRAIGQLGLRREHHHAVLDCAFEAHAQCLAHAASQGKPSRIRVFAASGGRIEYPQVIIADILDARCSP